MTHEASARHQGKFAMKRRPIVEILGPPPTPAEMESDTGEDTLIQDELERGNV